MRCLFVAQISGIEYLLASRPNPFLTAEISPTGNEYIWRNDLIADGITDNRRAIEPWGGRVVQGSLDLEIVFSEAWRSILTPSLITMPFTYLENPVSHDDTSWVVEDPSILTSSAYIHAGRECVRVSSGGTNPITVERGQFAGTTAVEQDAGDYSWPHPAQTMITVGGPMSLVGRILKLWILDLDDLPSTPSEGDLIYSGVVKDVKINEGLARWKLSTVDLSGLMINEKISPQSWTGLLAWPGHRPPGQAISTDEPTVFLPDLQTTSINLNLGYYLKIKVVGIGVGGDYMSSGERTIIIGPKYFAAPGDLYRAEELVPDTTLNNEVDGITLLRIRCLNRDALTGQNLGDPDWEGIYRITVRIDSDVSELSNLQSVSVEAGPGFRMLGFHQLDMVKMLRREFVWYADSRPLAHAYSDNRYYLQPDVPDFSTDFSWTHGSSPVPILASLNVDTLDPSIRIVDVPAGEEYVTSSSTQLGRFSLEAELPLPASISMSIDPVPDWSNGQNIDPSEGYTPWTEFLNQALHSVLPAAYINDDISPYTPALALWRLFVEKAETVERLFRDPLRATMSFLIARNGKIELRTVNYSSPAVGLIDNTNADMQGAEIYFEGDRLLNRFTFTFGDTTYNFVDEPSVATFGEKEQIEIDVTGFLQTPSTPPPQDLFDSLESRLVGLFRTPYLTLRVSTLTQDTWAWDLGDMVFIEHPHLPGPTRHKALIVSKSVHYAEEGSRASFGLVVPEYTGFMIAGYAPEWILGSYSSGSYLVENLPIGNPPIDVGEQLWVYEQGDFASATLCEVTQVEDVGGGSQRLHFDPDPGAGMERASLQVLENVITENLLGYIYLDRMRKWL